MSLTGSVKDRLVNWSFRCPTKNTFAPAYHLEVNVKSKVEPNLIPGKFQASFSSLVA